MVKAMSAVGYKIIYVSGLDECCRDLTQRWLDHMPLPDGPLYMRPPGSYEKDTKVKADLFWEHIEPKWDVVLTLDDRDAVVEMWRAMVLKCLQVQPGDF